MYARDHALVATPIGMVRLIGGDDWLESVAIEPGMVKPHPGSGAAIRRAATQIEEYFAGERALFDLSLRPLASPRGQVLRDGIAAVGYAETMTYGALARVLSSGPRAIGQACARNVYPIVVRCHRILGGSGHYSGGGGLTTKNWLLDHEQRHSKAINNG